MNKLISNYLFTVLYQLLLMMTPFITTPYVSRILKAQGIGIDAYVSSIVQLFIVFIVLSLPMYGSKQIAIKTDQKELSKEFWSIFTCQLIVSLLNLLVYFLFVGTVSVHKELFLINAATLLAYSIDISWFFIGKEQMKRIAIRNMLVKVAGIIFIFAFVKTANDLPLYTAINGGTLFLGQIIMWIPLKKEISFTKVTIEDMKVHVLPILALFLPQLMIQVYVLVNRIVLGNISGEIEVGYYNQANKVIRIALGVISSLGTVLLPRMASEFSKGNQVQFHKYIDSTLQFVLFITIPMTFGLIAIAPNFVVWFLGGEFLKVSPLLMIMSPVLFFVGLANVFGIQILISSNQQNKYSVAITIGAIVSLITNLLLVHEMGSVATTIALLVAEALGAIIQMFFARKYFSFTFFGKLFLRYSILGLLIFLSARMVGYVVTVSPVLLTMLQLGIGGTVYLIGLILIKDSLIFKLLGIMNQKKMVYSAKR